MQELEFSYKLIVKTDLSLSNNVVVISEDKYLVAVWTPEKGLSTPEGRKQFFRVVDKTSICAACIAHWPEHQKILEEAKKQPPPLQWQPMEDES